MYKGIERLFGDQNKRKISKLQKDVEVINGFESALQKFSDDTLRTKTEEFRKKLAAGSTLEAVKHEAFAVVREAARRTLGQRHFDVQLLGGLVLHSGNIAEMRTGEGKTLAATTATYLNALEGKGVHIITVNDYLARRDADWMGQIYHFLGLTVGCLQHNSSFLYNADIQKIKRHDDGVVADSQGTEGEGYEALITADRDHLQEVSRKEVYGADIVFGTNNEFGFDYLRDNMVLRQEDRVQRGLHFAIIDEVDSILVDEARTPLIISAPAQEATSQYYQFAELVEQLQENTDYNVDEKMRSVSLTPGGISKLEKALHVDNIYVASGLRTVHHIEQALKAKTLFQKDKDYVAHENEVVIIDEFTGRMLPGRRYSEGLHQAIEAKERLPIKQESRTLATITLQNYFRLYKKCSGMTGTAETEAEEFYKIYGLDVVVIPTHRDMIRTDFSDRVYQNIQGKYKAAIARIQELHDRGQPVLIGTVSIENNEIISELLTANGIPHAVLNAKHHEKEAEIIAQAGKKGAVTVATNMAGRGVDIILGGNPVDIQEAREVRELGGLAVIGTERHEARRIDNQLRGRSGRQGDLGLSQFFVSMDDDVMRIFGSDRMKNFMNRLGVPDDMPIENKMVSRSIEAAQKKVESRNFDIRKHLVEYDDVMNKHRNVIYKKRNEILDREPEKLRATIWEYIENEIEQVVSFHTAAEDAAEWNVKEIREAMSTMFPLAPEEQANALKLPTNGVTKLGDAQSRTAIIDFYCDIARQQYKNFVQTFGDDTIAHDVERSFVLRGIDMLWVEHLDQMSFLRDSIGLQGYAQKDPLVEYKHESYNMFQELLANVQRYIVYNIFKLRPVKNVTALQQKDEQKREEHGPAKEMSTRDDVAAPVVSSSHRDSTGKKIGRNEPCFCGSGKKYKKCHGA